MSFNAQYHVFVGNAHPRDGQLDLGHEEQHRSEPRIPVAGQRSGLGRRSAVAQTPGSLRQRRFRTGDVPRPRDVFQHTE